MNDEFKALRDALRDIDFEAQGALSEIEALAWAAQQVLRSSEAHAAPQVLTERLDTLLRMIGGFAEGLRDQINELANWAGCEHPEAAMRAEALHTATADGLAKWRNRPRPAGAAPGDVRSLDDARARRGAGDPGQSDD